ncbi:Suppressor of fused protein (SUFU) [Corynebacterium occultum]|uniref:Suppressor of fused protein (SUFU) n=1 Tax=Corynebacterium occultum TaxID=2675219 RepID=A0A6B8WCI6_9CORY|nr:suppressor of fused domain protein [Corynebacterium occultum]QGU07730.1 Suppressor of fused protein (SUFU) [Corynebacterium occultum]
MGFFKRIFGKGSETGSETTQGQETTELEPGSGDAGANPAGPRGSRTDPEWSPGQAVDEHLARIYPKKGNLKGWEAATNWRQGGPDRLDFVAPYRLSEPQPHWHYVGIGLTDTQGEVFEEGHCGYGLELSFRLADPAAADPTANPPQWPVQLLQHLARYVADKNTPLRSGDHLSYGGPFTPAGDPANLSELFFLEDPVLGSIDTPGGKITFIQVIGATEQDRDDAHRWNTRALIAAGRPLIPLGLTIPGRPDLRSDLLVAEQITAGLEREGSAADSFFTEHLEIHREGAERILIDTELRIIPELLGALDYRIPFGRHFHMINQQHQTTGFTLYPPGHEHAPATDEVTLQGDSRLNIALSDEVDTELRQILQAGEGLFPMKTLPITWRFR